MKINFYILTRILFVSATKFNSYKIKNVNNELVAAVHSVLDNVFFPLFRTMNIVTCVSNSKNPNFQDLYSKILQHDNIYNGTYIFRLDNYTNILGIRFRLKIYNIFLLDSFQSFLILNKSVTPNVFNFRGYYLFILTNGNFKDTQKMANILYDKMIFNSYVIYDSEGSVKILEFQLGRKNQCKNMRVIQVDEFKDGKLINKTDLFSIGNYF